MGHIAAILFSALIIGAAPSYSQNAIPETASLAAKQKGAALDYELASTARRNAIERFQAGDALRISAYPDSGGFPNGIYTIDGDGYADLPLIGLTSVSNLTPRQVELFLAEKYVTYLPRLNIAVRPLFRISLLGGFTKPGLYWIDPRESLWNAVERAGGTLRDDGISKIRWERDTRIVSKNITSYYQSGQSLYAIGFKSGDRLLITAKPKQQAWETFITEVLPVLGILATTVTAAATAYFSYETYSNRTK